MATWAAAPTGSEAKPAAFYGWRVVAAAFTVLFVAYGIQFSFGVFVKQITDDMGWSRAQVVLPYAVYVVVYSGLSSVSGWATDRYGPARVVAVGGVLLALGWGGLGLSHSLWQVYLSLGVVAAIGMSAAWVPCNATVVRWFVRRRGLAVGICSSGGSVGNLVVPPIATAVVGLVGWRSTLPLMAVVGAVLMVGCSRFMIRDPEKIGLHPDGDAQAPVATATSLSDADSFTAAEARRTATFWCLFGIFALTWVAVFVPFAHVVAFAKDLDIGALAASTVLSAIGLGGLFGRLSAGPLSDRIGRRATLAVLLSLQVGCVPPVRGQPRPVAALPGGRVVRRHVRRFDHHVPRHRGRPVRAGARRRHRRRDLRLGRILRRHRPVRRGRHLRRHQQLPDRVPALRGGQRPFARHGQPAAPTDAPTLRVLCCWAHTGCTCSSREREVMNHRRGRRCGGCGVRSCGRAG